MTLVLGEHAAHAFCRTRSDPSPVDDCASQGPSLFWKNKCVGYAVAKAASKKADLPKARSIVATAFETWTTPNKVCTPGVHVLEQPTSDANQIGFNKVGRNENTVVFRDDSWPYDDAGNPLALTTVTFNADTGEILDADIEVNTADKSVTSAEPLPAQGYDLQSIITHEVGHYFGLAHSKVNGATMEPRYDRGQTGLRTLELDDLQGICTIYPDETKRTTDLPGKPASTVPCGPCEPVITIPPPAPSDDEGCLCSTGPKGPSPTAPLVAAGIAGALILRRRRLW